MEKIELLNQFSNIANAPYDWFRENVSQPAIGYLCSYVPVELLEATGFVPLRIYGGEQLSLRINAHLQSYSCFIIKSALSLMLDGKLDFLFGAIFAHSCDSMQCLADIWELNSTLKYHDTFNMPSHLNNSATLKYTREELLRIKQNLENVAPHKITTASLETSIHNFNESQQLLQELYQLRRNAPALLTAIEFNNILIASVVMPRIEFNSKIKVLLNLLRKTEVQKTDLPRLFISGSICNDPRIFEMIGELGTILIDDDLCIGSRPLTRKVAITDDPLTAIASSLLERAPCPCKYSPGRERLEYLISRIKESGADGVIFYIQKYCEPHLFDYPTLKKTIPVPVILIEADKPGNNLGQIKSRLQAFVEMLTQ